MKSLVLVLENFWNVLPHGPQELCRALLFSLLTAWTWTMCIAFCSARCGKSQPVPLCMLLRSAVSCMWQILEGCLLLPFSVCSILQYPPVQLGSPIRPAFVLLADLAQVAIVTPMESKWVTAHARVSPEHFPCNMMKSLTESVMNHWSYWVRKAQAVKSTHVVI